MRNFCREKNPLVKFSINYGCPSIKGCKMAEELPKLYDPKNVDPRWYQFWLDLDLFRANSNSQRPAYCIVIPPPNVTGVLHMGHALVNTLQDILIRWKRMSGFETLWVPGTDHAGIATQTVVERHLLATTGKKRIEFTREEFLQYTWQWKEENEHQILGQLKKLGASCDWSRLRFTMDEGNNRAVRVIFKKLYDEGLIYQGLYLVNWDPLTQTALADDEVEYEEKEGFLWYFRYPLEKENTFIEIATTRPETMLGDTAIAVSPKDPRYKHLIGSFALHPLTKRRIPILGDSYVDPTFGTGAVKITPAHDPNDYKIGEKHSLPSINIMTADGKVNENGGPYESLTFAEAREAVLKDMKKKNLFIKAEPHLNRIGVSYRSKAVIEPYLSKQWFVKMSGFGKKLRQAVEAKKVKLIPENWENTYFHWIDNLRDWCISRQLWWGHRIPVWYEVDNVENKLCYAGEGIPPEVAKEPSRWVQDSDVLDTWFSSALWPFATLGWPEKTEDLKKFYPNATLITGHDILFFWVARMIAMGEYALHSPPFPEVFLHGLIYGKSYWRKNSAGGISYVSNEERVAYDLGKAPPPDVQFKWEKMSKSKGNVIDPLEIIEEYGTDAMRMALAASATQTREIDLDRRRFEEFRNFSNKIWNGARFVLMNLSSLTSHDILEGFSFQSLPLEDKWILGQLIKTVEAVNNHLKDYEFDKAAGRAYEFFWNEFCAFYVEFSKPYLFEKKGGTEDKKQKQKILLISLLQAIRLLHPMAPFITEELFQILKNRFEIETLPADFLLKDCCYALQAKACAIAPYPTPLSLPFSMEEVNTDFEVIADLIYAIRNLRGEMKLPPSLAIRVFFIGDLTTEKSRMVQKNSPLIEALIKTEALEWVEKDPKIPFASTASMGWVKIQIPLPEELLHREKARLEKELEKLSNSMEKLKMQLESKSFIEKAPSELVAKQKELLSQMALDRGEIEKKLSSLKNSS